MKANPRAIIKGLITYVPGCWRLINRGSGGTGSARYCYSVWLRHLVKAHEAGLANGVRRVAELGPGDSLGIGLSAMLSGIDQYYAFDAQPHADVPRNAAVFEQLVDLYSGREPIPDEQEFPDISPRLSSYKFPDFVLTEDRLGTSLHTGRVTAIRRAIQSPANGNEPIQLAYVAPWDAASKMERESVDMVFSQAVLEHVNDAPATYDALYQWLRPGGMMSHAIDFKSHGLAREWYGHWTLSDFMWKLVRGNQPYLINRLSHSQHIGAIAKAGFHIVTDLTKEMPAAPRALLVPRFRGLTEEDLCTSGTFVQALKPSDAAI